MPFGGIELFYTPMQTDGFLPESSPEALNYAWCTFGDETAVAKLASTILRLAFLTI
ncbi:MAG: hypothetical protein CLLPBCKN_004099 [Chroococcidiopsis cubana SAG 39.79]|uniref:hypothetical protein n=1 Tax=Chroococcidiopsis cubana TaxID=171392 RepID=UPI002AC64D91|nr:hypothetical protein [Chroococcidiopsis cubana]MDZ4874703.1 hypothetical protein [Chroococcidiopsis cubana SAG 39.79]